MTKQTSRYLLGLLLALAPAAASQAQQPNLRPGQVIVARQDTVVSTRVDTMVIVKKDTAVVVKYDTLSAAQVANAYAPVANNNNNLTDEVIARAVRIGVLEALQIAAILPQAQQQQPVQQQVVQQQPVVQQPVVQQSVVQQPVVQQPVVQQVAPSQRRQPVQQQVAVQQSVPQQYAQQQGEEDPTRPKYLQTWDKMQKRRHIQRVDRELMKRVYIPKGQWMMGATFNYQEWDTENINLLVLKNMELEGHTFSASPYFGYFLANNFCLGGRYNYHRDYFFLGQFDLNLGEDFNINLSDLYYLEHTHEACVFARMYQPLDRKNIFAFFSELRGIYAYSVGKNTTGSGAEFDGSFERAHTLQLAFCPGLSIFVTDFMATEASIGIMGLKYRWKNQHTNRVENGSSHSGGANFKFNLLSVNLGVTFYL